MELFAFDDDYVRRLREGDRFTVEHYERYFKVFLTAKLHRRVPPADIEDIIQDVHLAVLKGLHRDGGVREGHSFGAYVNSTCNHVVSDRRRRERSTEELDENVARDEDTLRDLITRETEAHVHRTLAILGKRDAEILRALFIDEDAKDEICRRFNVDRNYLRVLIHRALEHFRDKYDDE